MTWREIKKELIPTLLKKIMTLRAVVLRGRLMEGNWRSPASGLRYFSETKGRLLSEEERAKETVYIQKMERERMEKLRKKAEKEKAEKEKSDKKSEEGPHKN